MAEKILYPCTKEWRKSRREMARKIIKAFGKTDATPKMVKALKESNTDAEFKVGSWYFSENHDKNKISIRINEILDRDGFELRTVMDIY